MAANTAGNPTAHEDLTVDEPNSQTHDDKKKEKKEKRDEDK